MIIDAHAHLPIDRQNWSDYFKVCRTNYISKSIVSCLGIGDWPKCPNPEEVHDANRQAIEFQHCSDGLVDWLVYINPQNNNWQEELQFGIENHAIGIKLWCSIKDSDGDIDRTCSVLESAGNYNMPVLLHVFSRKKAIYPGEINFSEFVTLCKMFPGTNMIHAHAGVDKNQKYDILKNQDNAYFDISGFAPQNGQVERLIEGVGAQKILFGSDMYGRSLCSQLSKVLFAQINKNDKENILYNNAKELFKLHPKKQKEGFCDLIKINFDHYKINMEVDNFVFIGDSFPGSSLEITPRKLEENMDSMGIKSCFAASSQTFDGNNLIEKNSLFFEQTKNLTRINALATIDPSADDWYDVLGRAKSFTKGGFISPFLHKWKINDNKYMDFLEKCSNTNFNLWINCNLGDLRINPEQLQGKEICDDELIAFCRTLPTNKYIFQGLTLKQMELVIANKNAAANTKFEISRLIDVQGHLENFLKKYSPEFLVLGSEFPLRPYKSNIWSLSCPSMKSKK